MKTLQQVKDRMTEILATDKKYMKQSAVNRLKSEYEYLNTLKMYLETEPKVDFIEKEKSRLVTIINRIDEGFRNWLNTPQSTVGLEGKSSSQLKTYYNKINNVSTLKLQLKTTLFLLE